MKTLLLLRHAKSSWGDSSLADFDRPLAHRGVNDAPRMGRALKERGIVPDRIISSPAVRAVQTIQAVVKAAGLGVAPEFDEDIYGASSAELMRVVRRISDSSSCALLVGHNPGFEELLSRLTGARHSLPTAALAGVEFQIESWSDVEDGDGKLAWFMTPKLLK
jgi:phosphohistidine phosphatase